MFETIKKLLKKKHTKPKPDGLKHAHQLKYDRPVSITDPLPKNIEK